MTEIEGGSVNEMRSAHRITSLERIHNRFQNAIIGSLMIQRPDSADLCQRARDEANATHRSRHRPTSPEHKLPAMATFEHVKASFWGAGTYGVQPPLTDALIHQAEELLSVDLPPELLELLRLRNGGPVSDAWSAFPTRQPTSWSPDHVPFTDLHGIGHDGPATTLLDSPYLTTEWDLPARLVLLSGDGHYWIALDYRIRHEPSVTWFDTDMNAELPLAPDFRTFIEGLMPAEDLAG